jgi:thiol-disulfide isomerase/thioredoxin
VHDTVSGSKELGGFSVSPLRLGLFAFFAIPALLAQTANSHSWDGLTLLQRTGQHYASAGTWYIEATEERTSGNEYGGGWSKVVIVGAVSGDQYHFEGHSQTGSALHISDGKTAWDFHMEEHAYTQERAPVNGYQPLQTIFPNEQDAQRAVDLRKEFVDFYKHYESATRLPDEVIFQNGIEIPCYVVRVSASQRKGPKVEGVSTDETLWIDKATWAVRKTASHENSFIYAGGAHIPIVTDAVTTYSTTELDSSIPQALFRFEPPADAKLVRNFSNGFGSDLTGESAPDVTLVSADGKRMPLSSFRGKPVLLDFWATWCGPCVASMPKLAQLDKEAAPLGLVLISVDEDEDAKTATDFLVKHKFAWPNTHDDGKIGGAFKKDAIPMIVLINAQGKIVFDKTGDDGDVGAREALASLGPEYASLAPVQKQQPCQTPPK